MNITKVEPVLYEQPGAMGLVGFNFHYDNGDVYPLGPVMLLMEWDAVKNFVIEQHAEENG